MLSAAPPASPSLPDWVLAVVADSSTTADNAGTLMAMDINANSADTNPYKMEWFPVGTPLFAPPESALPRPQPGFSGMAFSADGKTLYAATSGPASQLYAINATTFATVGLPVPVTLPDGTPISIGDLALNPTTGALWALGAGSEAGNVYVITPASGTATLLEPLGPEFGDGLAISANGTLYATGELGGQPVLYAGGSTVLLTRRMLGLDWSPTLQSLVGSDPSGWLYMIDPSTGNTSPLPLAAGAPLRGTLGDVAFPPAAASSLSVVYFQNFEQGDGGYTADNSGGTAPGLWHYTTGRNADGLPDHSLPDSWYYGQGETSAGGGDYSTWQSNQGVLSSPSGAITLPASGTSILSFSYLLGTRDVVDGDLAYVSVLPESGAPTTILSRTDGTLPQTNGLWQSAVADLSRFDGQTIQLQFTFKVTASPPDPEGWYVDDVAIVNSVATPSISTQASMTAGGVVGTAMLSDSVTVSGGDNPTGVVTFTLTAPDNSTTTIGTVNVNGDGTYPLSTTVLATEVGTYTWHASYSGDTLNNGAVDNGANELLTTVKASPTISTTIDNAAGTAAITGSQALGTSVEDTASFSNLVSGFVPAGTVTYTLSGRGLAALTPPSGWTPSGGTWTDTVTVSGGTIPASAATGPLGAGTDYSFSAVYTPSASEANYVAATSSPEPLTISEQTPTVSTTIKNADGSSLTQPAALGTSVEDTAAFGNLVTGFVPAGTVTYTLTGRGLAALTPPIGWTVTNSTTWTDTATVSGGTIPASAATGPLGAGTDYSFSAVYMPSGSEANYVAATSSPEPLTISEQTPTVSTTIKNADGSSLTQPAAFGTSVEDTAAFGNLVTGFVPAGTVTYTFSGTGLTALTPPIGWTAANSTTWTDTAAVSGGTIPASAATGPLGSGTDYSFAVVYTPGGAEANYLKAASSPESLTISATIAGYVWDDSNNPNGQWEESAPENEPGLNGWTVYVVQSPATGSVISGATPGTATTFSASVTGSLVVGDWVQFGGNASSGLENQQVQITAISGSEYTVSPALPEPPGSGDLFASVQIASNPSGSGQEAVTTHNDAGGRPGYYSFSNLTPGDTYVVRELIPQGSEQTYPGPGQNLQWVVKIPSSGSTGTVGAYGQTEEPNFGDAPTQTVQFVTPLSYFRPTLGVTDGPFVRPADNPLAVTTTTSLTASAQGQSVTLTATVSTEQSGWAVPTGTVTFSDSSAAGTTTLGTVALAGGVATFTTASSLAIGSHNFTAYYAGPMSSSSENLTYDIEAGATGGTATATKLTAAPTSAVQGQSETLTATVSSSSGTPTGSVAFWDGQTELGTAPLNGSGVASFTTPAASPLALGSHDIAAVYAGAGGMNSSSAGIVYLVSQRACRGLRLKGCLHCRLDGLQDGRPDPVPVVHRDQQHFVHVEHHGHQSYSGPAPVRAVHRDHGRPTQRGLGR